ncbi:uncharacterized protein LOC142330418 [Lycorma delicatula]|uniref:uncharacterized protein LOC142330418 n=1 Tax=Lycorma delicatula TaxID=130591 RepID=UPI003F5158BD
MSRISQLTDWILPKLVESGCFGIGCEIDYQRDVNRSGEDQFASSVEFLELIAKSESGIRNFKVVIKLQTNNPLVWDIHKPKEVFQNEILIYSKIFPILDKNEIIKELCCKYYFGIAEPTAGLDKDFIVLEDLSDQDYKLSSEKIFLDYDHCALAMRAIGKFHGLSYAAKQRDLNLFMSTVSKLQSKWDDNFIRTWKDMFKLCGSRGVLPLIEANHSENLLKEFLRNYEDPVKFLNALAAPEEPEAVVCHGDFCRNNVFFRYGKDGRPDGVKLFDFQIAMYASPATELAFFLYMNTSQELRNKHWDDLLNAYKDGVKSVVPNMNVPEPNFKKFAAYGYIICSYFLPFMMDNEGVVLEELIALNPQEQARIFSSIGGEKGTQVLVDIVKHFLERDYIQASYE